MTLSRDEAGVMSQTTSISADVNGSARRCLTPNRPYRCT